MAKGKQRIERRQAILEAAIKLFSENGFSKTSISEVAKAANVSHGTVFLYFPSKEELFKAALLEPLAAAEEWFFRFTTTTGSPLERIRAMIQEHVMTMVSAEGYLRLTQYVLGLRERFPELAAELMAFSDRFIRHLTPIIEEGQRQGELAPGDALGIAVSYFAYVNGLVLSIFTPPSNTVIWTGMIKNGMRIFGPLKPYEEVSSHGQHLPGRSGDQDLQGER